MCWSGRVALGKGRAKWLLLGGEGGMQDAPGVSVWTLWAQLGPPGVDFVPGQRWPHQPGAAKGLPTRFARVTSKVLIH